MSGLQNAKVDLIIFIGEAANQFLRSRQVRGRETRFLAPNKLTSIRSGHRPGKSDDAMIEIASATWALSGLSAAVDSAIIAGTRSVLNAALSAS